MALRGSGLILRSALVFNISCYLTDLYEKNMAPHRSL